jgi:hypothetical protein
VLLWEYKQGDQERDSSEKDCNVTVAMERTIMLKLCILMGILSSFFQEGKMESSK